MNAKGANRQVSYLRLNFRSSAVLWCSTAAKITSPFPSTLTDFLSREPDSILWGIGTRGLQKQGPASGEFQQKVLGKAAPTSYPVDTFSGNLWICSWEIMSPGGWVRSAYDRPELCISHEVCGASWSWSAEVLKFWTPYSRNCIRSQLQSHMDTPSFSDAFWP